MNISKNLTIYMNKLGINSLRQLSLLSGVPYSTLKDIQHDRNTDIKLSTAIKLAKTLNVSLEELIK